MAFTQSVTKLHSINDLYSVIKDKYKIKIKMENSNNHIKHLSRLEFLNEKGKSKVRSYLNNLLKDIEIDENGIKKIFLKYENDNDFGYNDTRVFILNKDKYTLLFNAFSPSYYLLDENFNIIYMCNTMGRNLHTPSELKSKNFKLIANKLLVKIKEDKCGDSYVKRDIEGEYTFLMHGSAKIKSMKIKKDEIKVKYAISKYEEITFDKNFNMKEAKLSYSFYQKTRDFMSKRKITANSFEQLEEKLDDMFEMYSLTYDKKLKFITINDYNRQLKTLKTIIEHDTLFNTNIKKLENIENDNNLLSNFPAKIKEYLTNINDTNRNLNQMLYDRSMRSELNLLLFLDIITQEKIDFFNLETIRHIENINNKTFIILDSLK